MEFVSDERVAFKESSLNNLLELSGKEFIWSAFEPF